MLYPRFYMHSVVLTSFAVNNAWNVLTYSECECLAGRRNATRRRVAWFRHLTASSTIWETIVLPCCCESDRQQAPYSKYPERASTTWHLDSEACGLPIVLLCPHRYFEPDACQCRRRW